MDECFANPFYHALRTEHAHLAIGSTLALRYPADLIPFAALATPTEDAMGALSELLEPGETIYVTGDGLPTIAEIASVKELPCWQYHFPADNIAPTAFGVEIERLKADDSAAMVALTDVAFPGYYRPRAYLLGNFYGIRVEGSLVAMAGERVALPGCREISAVCTHPEHRGRGHAAALTGHILRAHAAAGLQSFLHVLQENQRAIELYERLGFERTIPVLFHRIQGR